MVCALPCTEVLGSVDLLLYLGSVGECICFPFRREAALAFCFCVIGDSYRTLTILRFTLGAVHRAKF